MNIFLFYEHLTREWEALQKLKDEFGKQGQNVFVYSIVFERSTALKMAKRNTPDIIFVPWLVDEPHEKILYPFVCLNPQMKVINLHHEEIGCECSEVVFMPKTEYAKNGSFHFVWGEYFKEKLLNAGVKEDRIEVTGNIRNDKSISLSVDKEKLSQQYDLKLNKKWILFAENRGYYVQRLSDELKNELLGRGMTEEYIMSRREYEEKGLCAFIDELKTISEEFYDEYEFIYRPHPGTKAPDDVPVWVHVIYDRPIYDWIGAVDLVLTCGSTSIFEAEMCGKPCAVYNIIEEPKELQVAGVIDYPQISALNEVSEKLIKQLNINSKIYKRYVGEVDGNSVQRVVKATFAINKLDIENEIVEFAQRMSKPQKRDILKHYFFEKVTWVMVKTGLLSKIKFPRSAYGEAKDIPYAPEANWIRE